VASPVIKATLCRRIVYVAQDTKGRGDGLYAIRCEVYGSPAHPGPRVAGSGGFGEYPALLTATRTRRPGLEDTQTRPA
jgi:hypothetical protein